MNLLKNKVAIVTGGTRGIGYSIVKRYLEEGAMVIVFGSREETVKKAVAQLKNINNDYKVEGFYPNLKDYKQVEDTINKVKEKYGKVDILVNNAGVSAHESIFDYSPEKFDEVMSLNVNSVFYGCKAVAPIMKNQGGGVIINTSSMVSIYGQPAGVAYPTSKFAVNGLTKSLARELAVHNIRVNAVAPGVTNTDMVANLPEAMREGVKKTIPLGRIGEPVDVANAFVYLASDMASYVTGEILSVDGCARS
ncbi:MAG: SDR family oxidoreductase [Clostridia bacterium]|nr:SDR family oxidoreductase [Clostridia bacterium]